MLVIGCLGVYKPFCGHKLVGKSVLGGFSRFGMQGNHEFENWGRTLAF